MTIDDARENFMSDVYNTLDFLPTNNEANRIIDSFDRVTSGLNQQPCDDCISRKATVERLCKVADFMNEKRSGSGSPYIMAALFIQDNKDEFPPVTPQPCEDAVNRAEALKALEYDIKHFEFKKGVSKYMNDIAKLLDIIFVTQSDAIKALPSVTPKEKTGKWIKTQSGDDMFPEIIVCSKCNNENSHLDFNEHSEPIGKVFIKSKYCPNCGARMVSE